MGNCFKRAEVEFNRKPLDQEGELFDFALGFLDGKRDQFGKASRVGRLQLFDAGDRLEGDRDPVHGRLFKQALDLDDSLYHSHLYLGKIYEQQGDKEKSIHHLHMYRKSAPLEEHIIDSP